MRSCFGFGLFLLAACSRTGDASPRAPGSDAPPALTVVGTPALPSGAAPGESSVEPPPATTAASAPSPTAEEAPPQDSAPTPEEVRACAARGGKLEPVCMLGHVTCVIRYADAGKPCTDKSNCRGECLYQGEQPPPAHPVGHCQATSDPCGCRATMIRGAVQPTLCID